MKRLEKKMENRNISLKIYIYISQSRRSFIYISKKNEKNKKNGGKWCK